MSYTPTTWTTGDTITASALNKIESGIADAGGGGYDAEVHIYHDNNNAHDYEITIISGTFADLASKMADGITPIVLFRVWDELNHNIVVAFGYIYSYDISTSDQYITFHAIQPSSSAPSCAGLYYIVWNADDEITL